MTDTIPETIPTTDTWAAQIEQLRARYRHVRPPILAALNVLLHDKNISVHDAKAQASLHGVKITAASVSAAQRLLSRMDDAPTAPTMATAPALARGATAAPTRPTRRVRAPEPAVDAEALIRQVVGRIQSQGNAETEKLREAVRKAITVLQAAVG